MSFEGVLDRSDKRRLRPVGVRMGSTDSPISLEGVFDLSDDLLLLLFGVT